MKKLCIVCALTLLLSCFCGGCDLSALPFFEEAQTQSQEEASTTTVPSTAGQPVTTAPTEAESELPSARDALYAAVEGLCSVVTEQGETKILSSYLRSQYNASMQANVLVDLDRDSQTEMVILTDSSEASYIVLHCEETTVFAFVFGHRSMGSLKTDGSFIGSSGADSTDYCRMRFLGGRYILDVEASQHQNTYTLNGELCTAAAFTAFTTNWNGKVDVTWDWFDFAPGNTEPAFTSYTVMIPRANQKIYSAPGYQNAFVCMLEVPGIYTITEEQTDSQGNLWGKLRSGAGWVDLTQIRNEPNAPQILCADYADSFLLASGNYYPCVIDTSEYRVRVALRTNATVVNFQIMQSAYDSTYGEYLEELFYVDELKPGKPVVADLFFGDITEYVVRAQDYRSGQAVSYRLYISGMDGSLVMTPIH